jgi:uncharacterized protein YdhG (YjbR/CyaY superfamily)
MQSKAPSIAAYISELTTEKRVVIEALDRLVRSSLEDAVGTMKFGMPTYEIGGRMIALNAQKNYFSLYVDSAVVKRHHAELKGLDCGKCCIRFRKLEDLPLETIRRMIEDHGQK